MKGKILFVILAGILALSFLQGAAAYTSYDYSPRYGGAIYVGAGSDDYDYRYGRNFDVDYDSSCKYLDYGALKWKTDRVCAWVENGDGWREETLRARAVVTQANSYDARYNIQSGRSSGDAFYYHYGDKSETKPSDWRYKTAFDPRVDNEYVKGYGYYYYEPRYDSTTKTFNWRF